MSFGMNVEAEEITNNETTEDMTGEAQSYVTSGYFDTYDTYYYHGGESYTRYRAAREITCTDGYIYIIKETEKNEDGVKYVFRLCGSGKAEMVTTSYFLPEDGEDYIKQSSSTDNYILKSALSETNRGEYLFGYTEYESVEDRETYYGDFIFESDIPIFNAEDTEGIGAYEESGNWTGAENAPDYSEVYDESIPLPHNLRILKGTDQVATAAGNAVEDHINTYPVRFMREVVVAWDQEDAIDGLQYQIEGDITTVFIGKDEASGDSNIKEYKSGYHEYVKKTSYNGTSCTIIIPTSQLNANKGDGLLSKMTIRVRNVCGGTTSKWVLVTIDFVKQTATATEQDVYDNEDTGGSEYNDTPVSDGTLTDGGNISTDGFLSYIRSGFGLLGNGGIIALLSSVFLYLPATIWSMLYSYLALIIVIAVGAFFIKVVF